MKVVFLVAAILAAQAPASAPQSGNSPFPQYQKAIKELAELRQKYADDEVNIGAPISDRTREAVLAFGAVACRNFDSPNCPSPIREHNIKVLNPEPGDVFSSAVIRGTFYFLRRETGKNSLGAEVPVFVYYRPKDLLSAVERVAMLKRAVQESGLDLVTGEPVEQVKARQAEEARKAAEKKRIADQQIAKVEEERNRLRDEERRAAELERSRVEAEQAKKLQEWAAKRELLRPESRREKQGSIFLVEDFPEGCLVEFETYGATPFQVLIPKDNPPEILETCWIQNNYQKRVRIVEPVDLCLYLGKERLKRGVSGGLHLDSIGTYSCNGDKRCLLYVESPTNPFPCPTEPKPTEVANPFKR